MSLVKQFFLWFFGTNKKLSILEKMILDEVRQNLKSDLLKNWDMQVGTINKIQRLSNGVEVDFYRVKNDEINFKSFAFPNKQDELLLANVTIQLTGLSDLTASVWCVKGNLFCIEYGSGFVDYYEEATGMDPTPEIKLSCDLKADLSRG